MNEPATPSLLQDTKETLDNLPFHKTPYDRQLVRTTFKLSHEALEVRAWLAGHYKLSMADALAFAAHIAGQLQESVLPFFLKKNVERDVRRTLVLSKGALGVIEDQAKELGRHRDEVLEAALQALAVSAREDSKETAALHEQALPIIERVYDALYDAEKELNEMLGTEDPVVIRHGYLVVMIENLRRAINEELTDGTPVDPDEF